MDVAFGDGGRGLVDGAMWRVGRNRIQSHGIREMQLDPLVTPRHSQGARSDNGRLVDAGPRANEGARSCVNPGWQAGQARKPAAHGLGSWHRWVVPTAHS